MRIRRLGQAFTLSELLIVMAIVGLLAALIIPAVKSVQAKAASVQCLSNLRQIGKAIFIYKADNNGRMMPYAAGPGKYWLDLLAPYMPPPKDPTYLYSRLLCCPADKRPRTPTNPQTRYTDYGLAGLNGILFGVCNPETGLSRFSTWLYGRAPNPAALPHPSKAMMVSDIDRLWWWSSANIDDPVRQSWRHNNGINCVFADGHAERRTKEDVPTDPKDVFWNGGNPDPVPVL